MEVGDLFSFMSEFFDSFPLWESLKASEVTGVPDMYRVHCDNNDIYIGEADFDELLNSIGKVSD